MKAPIEAIFDRSGLAQRTYTDIPEHPSDGPPHGEGVEMRRWWLAGAMRAFRSCMGTDMTHANSVGREHPTPATLLGEAATLDAATFEDGPGWRVTGNSSGSPVRVSSTRKTVHRMS